jgi:hypothetical protein
MSKKKTAIGDLIQSDMQRRAIGDTPGDISDKVESGNGGTLFEMEPMQSKESTSFANTSASSRTLVARAAGTGSTSFAAFIDKQASLFGLTDEKDFHRLYDFLQGQAIRYIRGFHAGRRFYS